MGCCEGCGQILLVLINLLFSLIGIALLVVACLVRFGSDLLDSYLQDAYSAFQKALEDAASDNNINISDLDIGDIAGDASLAFIVIGAFFFILGIFGCIGAVCKVKFLLIVYTIVLMTIFIAELVFVILLFTIKSTLDGWIRSPLITKLQDDYTGINGNDTFTLTMNFVMHEFECCGIDNYKEFNNSKRWKRTIDQTIPFICCKNSSDTQCVSNPSENNSFIDQGCYEAVNNWLTDHSSVLIGVGTSVAAIQLLLIIFSLVICCQSRKDDDDKNSYSDDIAIQPYREPEGYGHQNDYYNGSPPSSHSDLRSQQYRYGPRSPGNQYNDRIYPEPYKGRHDYYTGPPEGYGTRDPYRR
ncbi:tetraspanin-1-like [Mercenaria mercenaria]|uniref:tetraspanin-1-like n=1 Tax=Mercenaria mercenaria TaxID=6596 RepID=UPI001E1D87FC|nr:tetraspanin-1-like [Mercenaria mercenaria]XP_045208028.1 tetraspanin-1-like [Mercenaria mercenaria]XP_053408075.1 tetraspanin-1-like [Mercenaria mercenaria]